uniref:VTT domain-containing protein n=1 Tax=Anopheles atroparvus TaxID=41427 RepID=A0A182ISM4_ANOAO
MNLPADDGFGFVEKANPSEQTTKTKTTQNDCTHIRCPPSSPTFFQSTANIRTRTVPEIQFLKDTASLCASTEVDSRTHSFVVQPQSWKRDPAVLDTTSSPLAFPEALYTVVSLEGTNPADTTTTAPKSFLLDFDPTAKHPLTSDSSQYFLVPEVPLAKASVSQDPTRKKDPIAMRDTLLYRMQRIVVAHRKAVLNYLLPLCLLTGLVLLIYSFRDTAKGILYWIETQNTWTVFIIFLCMFTIVSFPVTVGYLVLIIACGYLFGFVRGLLTVVIGANLGVAIAHNTIKSLQVKLPVHKLIKNETGRAILRVISGPRAFKIVLFARLTPIPFGLQNTIFGISSVNTRSYHAGTLIGLLPAQTINVYLGSKLRSIHEVLNDHNAALGLAGYGVFVVEVIVGAALMVWVIQKARLELSAALLASADADSDEKILIEIEA